MHLPKLLLLLTGAVLVAGQAHAVVIDYQLPGTTDRDEWNTLNRASNTNNRYRVGQGNWTSAANAIQSNTPNQAGGFGSAFLNTLANNSNGFSASTTAPAGLTGTGNLIITDDSPVAGIETVILQLDYSALHPSNDLTPGSQIVGQPILRVGGELVGGDGLADFFEANDTSVPHPGGFGYNISAGNYAWQWDLSAYTFDSGSLTIQWSTTQAGTLLNTIRFDQGNQFVQVVAVPEPATSLLLLGAGGLIAFRLFRRNRA